jgi:hypothetical protein
MRWRRREHIVDSEVSVSLGPDSSRVVGDISTEERSEYGIFTCRPDIASGPNQAFSFDLDFPVRLHAGLNVTNHPRLSGGDDTKDKISSKRRGVASHRNNPNPALESHERISAHDGKAKNSTMSSTGINTNKAFFMIFAPF